MKFFIFLALALLLGPEMAFAQTISPGGKDAWDLYVSGNGRVIADTLQAISLLMSPDEGNTGYRGLMVLVAILGFLVLAVKAGFQPTQGLLPMFGYIFVAWIVGMFTFSYKANITVNDPVNNFYQTVPQTPALATLPAALVSEIGVYFTRSIETYFRIPAEFKTTAQDGLGGSYNLFATMLKESDQFVFRNSNLKKSFSAYIGDCTIPAIALGRLNATLPDGTKLSGLDALSRSPNMMETLAQAGLNGVMTRYYPADPKSYADSAAAGSNAGLNGVSAETAGSFGLVLSCAQAFDNLKKDLEAEGQQLLAASAKSWSKTGTLVPFETAMTLVQEAAAAGGSGRISGGSSSFGFIQQQAMLSSLNGSLRESAAAVGNNEYIMASSIAQAEQSQKSAWASAAIIFNNMMGYVYAVLQAFIFALTPLVIVAMLIPGLGKSILSNYGAILIWLALWTPMLAIVNYLVTLFGMEQVSGILGPAGGITLANKYVVSEKVNDLMIAAQFLGTMVPLLAWGLVKGSMAFTEFISSGIGNSFATQAGAAAATGNLSMGNMSMGNTSMNKFNTTMSAAVGTQAVQGSNGAGGALLTSEMGGASVKVNDGTVSDKSVMNAARQEQLQQSIATVTQASTTVSAAMKEGRSLSESEVQSFLQAHTIAVSNGAQFGESTNTLVSALSSASAQQGSGTGIRASESDQLSNTLGVGADAGIGTNGLKLSAGGSLDRKQTDGTSIDRTTQVGSDFSRSDQASAGESRTNSAGMSTSASDGSNWVTSSGSGASKSYSMGTDAQKAMQDTLSEMESVTRTMSMTNTASRETGVSNAVAVGDINHIDQVRAASSDATFEATRQGLNTRESQIKGDYSETRAAVENAVSVTDSRIKDGPMPTGKRADMPAEANDAMGRVRNEAHNQNEQRGASAQGKNEDVNQMVSDQRTKDAAKAAKISDKADSILPTTQPRGDAAKTKQAVQDQARRGQG